MIILSAPEPGAESVSAYQRRVDGVDWTAIAAGLDDLGCALTPRLLTAADAGRLIALYDRDDAFRSTIAMGRHQFGEGEYRYLASPLPEAVKELRHSLYPHLLPIARDWYTRLGRPTPWPGTLYEWLDICHRAGQTQPTPLILKYGPGDWNCAGTATSTVTTSFPCRWSSTSPNQARTTPAASSFLSSNVPAPSPAAPR